MSHDEMKKEGKSGDVDSFPNQILFDFNDSQKEKILNSVSLNPREWDVLPGAVIYPGNEEKKQNPLAEAHKNVLTLMMNASPDTVPTCLSATCIGESQETRVLWFGVKKGEIDRGRKYFSELIAKANNEIFIPCGGTTILTK